MYKHIAFYSLPHLKNRKALSIWSNTAFDHGCYSYSNMKFPDSILTFPDQNVLFQTYMDLDTGIS